MTSSPRPRPRAKRWTPRWSASAPPKCPATRIGISTSRRTIPGRPSSTSWRPIWLLTYNYGPRNFQVVINGYTGAIAGKYPKSWIKITLAILTVASLLALFLLLANR